MKKTSLSLLIATTLACLTSGCATTAKQLVIAPQAVMTQGQHYQQKSAQVLVDDLRNTIHLVEIHQEDAAAELINSQENLGQTIAEHLTQALVSSGLDIKSPTNNSITLIINNAIVKVQQGLLKYQANTQLTFTVRVKSGEQVLTKTYNTKLNSEGAFNADLAVLERDFNQQLSTLLQQIVNDSEIYQFLQ
ncbi:YajG family lipoprotein [Thalassotalea sp. G2M2-11]|uniref:YajG family lipoprotein n=1 Tax=Thalassotalea sp. G2M2-11 TaxID=2787627 RepID=UPI0019D1DF56|nr:YajG family lipoprotein [Thalassotalea sp. G2M2-11]